jgi:sulfoxide reductase heme-binding subunit YedZ
MKLSKIQRRGLWWVLFIGISIPLVWMLYQWFLAVGEFYRWGIIDSLGFHQLGANPIEYTNRYLGDWALRFLLFSLAVTPLARILKFSQFVGYRRMIGLWAFTYVVFHLSSYIGLDQFFAWGEIWKDILKRNYITLGMIAVVLLTPMAITSTKGWIKRLGAKSWKNIHKAIYVAAPLGAFHYEMMARGNQLEPKIYIGITIFLLLIRVWFYWSDKQKTAAKKAAA